jgi:hypothetical protein
VSFADAVAGLTLPPEAWWRLDEGSGPALADATGNGHSATVFGGATYGADSIAGDGALLLNGTSGYVEADSYAPFVQGSARTFVALMKRNGQSGIRNFFGGTGPASIPDGGALLLPVLESAASSPDRFRYYGDIVAQFPAYTDWSQPEPTPGEWLLVALRVDDSLSGRSIANLWVNGIDYGYPDVGAGGPSNWNASSGRFMFGARPVPPDSRGEFHSAAYDEVMVFEGLLPGPDIQALAASVDLYSRPAPIPVAEEEEGLTWELTDLRQNVIATLDDRDAGAQVTVGRNVARTATLGLDLDDPAAQLASVGETLLRCLAPGWSRPLFVGRVIQADISYNGQSADLKLSAADPLYHLERCLVFGTAAMSPAAETFITYFSDTDPSTMIASLIASTADNGHGIVTGSLDTSAANLKLGFPAGMTVAEAIRSIAGLDGAPEFELAPVAAGDGTLAELNTYHPHQGTDKSAEIVLRIGSGVEDELLGFEVSPSMAGFTNRYVTIGDAPPGATATSSISGSSKVYPRHPAYRASHQGLIDRYGVWESTESLPGSAVSSLLLKVARAAVAANANVLTGYRVTLDPDLAPTFAPEGDFWLGDTVGVEVTTPGGRVLDYTGRVASASLTEAENGDVLTDLLLEVPDDPAGVTGAALSVVVDSAEGTTPPPPPPPEPDPCAPVADTGGPECPDAGSTGVSNALTTGIIRGKVKKRKKKK